ncbi:hypothetical protein FACS1894126_3020 [Alphaproteobacteria bacterium]|nr:hypothetical protein FACS1894126_3020 [Alphaproteobacteria bacterium]
MNMKKIAVAIALLTGAASLEAMDKKVPIDEKKKSEGGQYVEMVKVAEQKVLPPLFVDGKFEIHNGLPGMNRDVILKLC